MVRYWVRDHGIGLSPGQQATLFTEFSRLQNVNMEGHGLGLSVVKRIVETLGGQVGIESEMGFTNREFACQRFKPGKRKNRHKCASFRRPTVNCQNL